MTSDLTQQPATRVGVMILDSIDEPHRSVAGDYDVLLSRVLSAPDVELVFVDGRAPELPDHAACDGWVIGGSRRSVYDDDPWIRSLEHWIARGLEARVPLAGICFGHQLVGRVLGAPVERADHGWSIGAIDYEVHRGPTALGPLPESFRLLASHQDQLVDLPAGATLLASAPNCPIAGFTVDDHVLCVQAHPEWVPELAHSLYRSRVDRIGPEVVSTAIGTLDRPLDRRLVGDWILSTIRTRREDLQSRVRIPRHMSPTS